jgi:ferredoxin
MPLEDKTLKLCSCNRTMPLDAKALARTFGADRPVDIHTELCRREIAAFESAARAGECVVACTQEAPLFTEVAEAIGAKAELKFVNIREVAGWSAQGAQSMPKIAALLATADLPEPEPMPSVAYKSGGALLVIGPADAAVQWAARLAADLDVSVLVTNSRGGELPDVRRFPVWSGRVTALKGWLGAFEVEWEQTNPIDLEVCTRCNACIRACPEQAIDFTYQIDLERC